MKYLLAAFVLVGLAACGGASETIISGDTTTTAVNSQDGSTSTSPPGGSTTLAPGRSTTSASNRQKAPDFTLELGEGGTYTLSDGAKPVYLVFWSEW